MKGFVRSGRSTLGGSLPLRDAGRLVGWFFLAAGMAALASLPFPITETLPRASIALVALMGMAVGTGFASLPWDRWPGAMRLSMAPIGLVLAAAGVWLTIDGPVPEGGLVYLVALLALTGLVYPRGTTLLFGPLAAAAYVLPALLKSDDPARAGAAAFAIPMGMILGETLAWVVKRWRDTDHAARQANRRLGDAYRKQRADLVRMQEVDAMKNAFLAAVSHELRTPLTAILGISSMLERTDVFLADQERHDLMARVASNGRRLQQLLTDLLDLNRLTHGVLDPELAPADLGALVRRVAAESDIPERRIEVWAPSVWISVDAPKVERIVVNLLQNAGKYTPPGTNIWVRLDVQDEGVLLLVEDDGPGVPHELKRQIFEPFRQGVSLHQPGTGIGLSLVQRFAALHGGTAEVWDRPGGGASFRVFLPGSPTAAPKAEISNA